MVGLPERHIRFQTLLLKKKHVPGNNLKRIGKQGWHLLLLSLTIHLPILPFHNEIREKYCEKQTKNLSVAVIF